MPWPAVDVTEDERTLTVRADLPGLEAKDVDIEVSGNLLTLRSSRAQEHKEGDGGRYRHERYAGAFARTISLPPYADAERAEARYDNGVLTVTVPRVPGAAPKRVPVQPAGQ